MEIHRWRHGSRYAAGPTGVRQCSSLIALVPQAHGEGTTDETTIWVPGNGRRLWQDVYQRVVNANFNLNVHPTPLMSDVSDCALDERGASDHHSYRCERRLDHDLQFTDWVCQRAPAGRWGLRVKPGSGR